MSFANAAWYPVARLCAALVLMTVGGAAMYASILVLEPARLEFGTGRGAASLPYAAFMIGFGVGGVLLGRLSDRFGVGLPALLGSVLMPAGLAIAAQAGSFDVFLVSLGVLCGLLGSSVTFAPLVADISHWFSARRGLAVGIVISGAYVAGVVWPVLLQGWFDSVGWRVGFERLAFVCAGLMLPLALVLLPRAPVAAGADDVTEAGRWERPLGLAPIGLQSLLCCAGLGCCVAMAMPQVHIVPLVIDLGYAGIRGAEMLTLMLGFGVVSRIVSGWLSDRIGGLRTLALGSACQGLVLLAMMFADTLTALYLLSAAFGLSQGGIVPSYAIIVRRFFAPTDAGWRIGTVLLFTICGMALGGFLSGALYDLTGSYTASFVNAIGFNVLNLAVAAELLRRHGSRQLSQRPQRARPS